MNGVFSGVSARAGAVPTVKTVSDEATSAATARKTLNSFARGLLRRHLLAGYGEEPLFVLKPQLAFSADAAS